MENIIANAILQTIRSNQQLLALTCAQKAKFENWLKFELAFRLKVLIPDTVVEYKIPNGNKRVDIRSGNCYIELKTTNTNVSIPILSPRANGGGKPITQNINDIIDDVNNLRRLVTASQDSRYVATIFFPYDTTQVVHITRLKQHIGKGVFVELDTDINTVPVRIFVAKV